MEKYNFQEMLMAGFAVTGMQEYYDLPKSEQNHEGKRIEVAMKYIGEMPELCPRCGEKMYSHSARPVQVVDVTFLGNPTKLRLTFPRKRCPQCGLIYQPKVDNIVESRNMTKRLYFKIANLALKRSFEDIAKEYGVSNNTAKNVFKEHIRAQEEDLRFRTPSFLGLDEIKIKKLGEVTVITDLEHRTLYDMLQGRNQTQLPEYFSRMPDRERVLWVCTDMYRPFEKSIKQNFPNARWVIDRFHVVAYANRAMDIIRIKVQNELTKNEQISTKKGLAYTLRTRQRDLTPEEAAKIRNCRKSERLQLLATAYDLKEDFFNIYDDNRSSLDNAKEAFAAWERSLPADKELEPFRELAKTVYHFYEQIFNYWLCPISITNGLTECSNRIIRENNVRGRGNSFEILRGRTLYRQANLEHITKSGMIGPPIPKKGPVFYYEEVKRKADEEPDSSDSYDSFSSNPLMGLIPGIHYDPETGELLDDTILEEWEKVRERISS